MRPSPLDRARFFALALAVLLAVPVAASRPSAPLPDPRGSRVTALEAAHEDFAAGVEAYRRGDFETARALWSALVHEPLPRAARGVLFYDLGNAAYRTGRELEAVAWYTSAVRAVPRNGDAWSNLEFVRREAGLEPADRGDLSSTLARLLTALDRGEAAWLVLASLGLLALALAGEAVRGGTLWRRLSLAALLWTLVSAAPLAWQLAHRPRDPLMIVAAPSAALRSEPRETSQPVAQAPAGDVVERIDSVPGWERVLTGDGERGWVTDTSVHELHVD